MRQAAVKGRLRRVGSGEGAMAAHPDRQPGRGSRVEPTAPGARFSSRDAPAGMPWRTSGRPAFQTSL